MLKPSRFVTDDCFSPLSACHLLLSTVCDDVSARPSLFISLDNGDLLIYNSFPVTNAPNGHIPLAFARFHHGIITRPLSASGIESRPFAVSFSLSIISLMLSRYLSLLFEAYQAFLLAATGHNGFGVIEIIFTVRPRLPKESYRLSALSEVRLSPTV
ncbi:hypothetical protein BVRB_027380 [Beta vulgaris subsp. vulgaris]|uniref:Uncharacterized protein n=1 Tax=Beta vulgaris subsp. vulgaris TaxID=3555 RepID=A0A0J8DSW0_BETVV|nr:hypothetical protein BVRB_027380 [Beta vulgaris subsp. vulgaris]